MRRYRNAKIIATLGPATSSESCIGSLFKSGVDVFRLNFSHGNKDSHKLSYDIIRNLESKYDRPVGILLDLQGPKLRVGRFQNGSVKIIQDQIFFLDMDPSLGDQSRVSLPHPEIFKALKPGTSLLVDDGKIQLVVESSSLEKAKTRVIVGGVLSDNKGVNIPGALLEISSLTIKDRGDLDFGLNLGVDWVGLSFVQRASDVIEAKAIIGNDAFVMTKIEKPQAMDCLDEIVDVSDGLMVARGDLGVECLPEDVPGLQKRVVRLCREAGKPVVIATQMLDSMVKSPTPTRAEVSDVATAIFDGADAVMLSAETAVGEYPLEAVGIMNRIISTVEQDNQYLRLINLDDNQPEATPADAITAAARQVANTISASCVVIFSTTGSTSLRLARERPTVPILGLTPRKETARRLTLVWGIHSVLTKDCQTFREMVTDAVKVARDEEFGKIGDSLIITAGVPFGTPGKTNILRIAWIE